MSLYRIWTGKEWWTPHTIKRRMSGWWTSKKLAEAALKKKFETVPEDFEVVEFGAFEPSAECGCGHHHRRSTSCGYTKEMDNGYGHFWWIKCKCQAWSRKKMMGDIWEYHRTRPY
jgi:hypothetical protein